MIYYVIRLYRGKKWAGAFYEEEGKALEGFGKIKGHLGNPLVNLKFSIALEGEKVGEMVYDLDKFNRAELVEVTVSGERILDRTEVA